MWKFQRIMLGSGDKLSASGVIPIGRRFNWSEKLAPDPKYWRVASAGFAPPKERPSQKLAVDPRSRRSAPGPAMPPILEPVRMTPEGSRASIPPPAATVRVLVPGGTGATPTNSIEMLTTEESVTEVSPRMRTRSLPPGRPVSQFAASSHVSPSPSPVHVVACREGIGSRRTARNAGSRTGGAFIGTVGVSEVGGRQGRRNGECSG